MRLCKNLLRPLSLRAPARGEAIRVFKKPETRAQKPEHLVSGYCSPVSHSRGQAMVELAISLPLLIVLFLAIFEWGQIFVKHMEASTLSREAAITAHNECIQPVPLQNVVRCLNQVCGEIMAGASAPLAGGTIIISLQGVVNASSSCPVGSGFASQYAGVPIAGLPTISVGEFFFDNPLLTPIENFLNLLNVMPRLIYKVTVV